MNTTADASPHTGRHRRRHVVSASGDLRVVLYAERPADRAGPVPGAPVDVDLGCLYELADGRRGVVQALGERFGAFDRPPFVLLERGQRAWAATGASVFVNLDRAGALRRLLVFACVRAGPPHGVRLRAEFEQPGGARFAFTAPAAGPADHACALALIEAGDPAGVSVCELSRYVPGYQEELDRAYGFGLSWGTASGRGPH